MRGDKEGERGIQRESGEKELQTGGGAQKGERQTDRQRQTDGRERMVASESVRGPGGGGRSKRGKEGERKNGERQTGREGTKARGRCGEGRVHMSRSSQRTAP